jgi:hypothetical protein
LKTEDQIVFAPFRLDTLAERLYRGAEPVVLRPKSLLHHSTKPGHNTAVRARRNDPVSPQSVQSAAAFAPPPHPSRGGQIRLTCGVTFPASRAKILLEENSPMEENVCQVPTSLP